MNAAEIEKALETLAAQLIGDLPDLLQVSIAGIVSHGAILAMRVRDLIERRAKVRLPCAALDVHSGRDHLHTLDGAEGEFEVEGRTIVIVDDVINSGWTVQRAMDTLWESGRPAAVKLAVLIDRGHRAVPIRPNYVGKNIPTARSERVQVRLGDGDPERGRKSADRAVIYSMVESLKIGEREAQNPAG